MLCSVYIALLDSYLVPAFMSPPPLPMNTCPFCGQRFVRLGNHLPHCKQRHGQDYTSLLVKKRNVPSGSCRGVCPKCSCVFKRLDTHLCLSTTCQDIASPHALIHPHTLHSPRVSPTHIRLLSSSLGQQKSGRKLTA